MGRCVCRVGGALLAAWLCRGVPAPAEEIAIRVPPKPGGLVATGAGSGGKP